jgi:cytochrome b involved in lipid metabolism
MKQIAFTLIAIALLFLFFGCITINPSDLNTTSTVPNTSSNSNTSSNPNSSTGSSSGSQTMESFVNLSASEIAKHNSMTDCWMIIEGKVYDLSAYVGHPGGSTYVPYCGIDGTTAYNSIPGRGKDHSAVADSQLAGFLIGALGQDVNITKAQATVSQNASTQPAYPRRGRNFEDD